MRVWKAPFAFWLWTHPNKVRSDEEFVHAFLKPGDVFVDCGAHLGTLTITASKKVGLQGKVIACEPVPKTFTCLKKNIEDNACHNVKLHKLALGSKIKTAQMETSYISDMNHVEADGNLEVQMTTLDHLLKKEKKITLLKLDVEGQEYDALLGAENILDKVHAIYFESAPETMARVGYQLMDIVNLLAQHHFMVFKPTERGELIKVDEYYVTKQRYEDLLAVKKISLYTERMTR